MALSPRLIRRRIRSVQNTKKITKAMELVAAAKMRRAVAAALKSRAYANLAWTMVQSLEGSAHAVHPLLGGGREHTRTRAHEDAKRRRTLTLVIASDRGLCGGFNAQLFRAVVKDAESHSAASRSYIAVGKKAEAFIHRMGWPLLASFANFAVTPTVAEVRPIARMAIDAFLDGSAYEVRIAFTDFISSLKQQSRVRTLLPLQRIEEMGVGEAVGPKPQAVSAYGFLFEPSPAAVLDAMLPRLTELQVYQTFLESGASEHSARMFAMRSASDAAKEMIDGLSLAFNSARQALITREIAEISAGSAALGG